MEPLRVFIGYDPSESVAAQVLAHSVFKRASGPVSITFLRLETLREVHKRDRNPLQSTEFSFTRFLVPYLCGYRGRAVFLDCDMLVLDDIYQMVENAGEPYSPVCVVKHEHKPHANTNMLGQVQTRYECKNWSSVMLFWCDHHDCRNLTPEYVDTASGLDLHQFKWLETGMVGRLPHKWNHLVGYDPDVPAEQISLLHWTEGGPWWKRYAKTAYSDLWRSERTEMLQAFERVKHEAA